MNLKWGNCLCFSSNYSRAFISLFYLYMYVLPYFHLTVQNKFWNVSFFSSYIVSFRLGAWMHNICNANISRNPKYFVYNCIGRLVKITPSQPNDGVNLTFIVIKHIVLRKMTLRTCHSVNSFFSVETGVRDMARAKSFTS